MKTTIAIAAVSLAVGAAAGYAVARCGGRCAPDDAARPELRDRTEAASPQSAAASADAAAELDAARSRNEELRQEVDRLNGQLSKASADLAAAKASLDKAARKGGGATEAGKDREPVLAGLRKEGTVASETSESDANERAIFASKLNAPTDDKLEFLASLDVSWMSAEERETYDGLLALLKRQKEQQALLVSGNVSSFGMMKVLLDCMNCSNDIKKQGGAVRETLLRRTVGILGYGGGDAEEIVTTLGEIYSATADENLFSTMAGMAADMRGGVPITGDDLEETMKEAEAPDAPAAAEPEASPEAR